MKRVMKRVRTVLGEGRLKMKRFYSNHKTLIGLGGGRFIDIPCSENDILYLEKICMEPGFHHIHVHNLAHGRYLIAQILHALSWHQDIGYLSLKENVELQQLGTNILKQLNFDLTQENLASFFIESFYFDFLLIENSSQLASLSWVETFDQLLIDYKIDHMIPVVILDQNA